ncbi:P-loop containing nucleoside triphosphate hydrolase protein [Gilbertella persicaria]|uniref:P-loop containing nucleoside triphosphate hydrolase protein n=1 Tax=Gilbertella persicaria TaxID=101096 RepID=UPI0022210490|nr:P-loop containing nucleoside triphosphate hydrolase protein [Gilbertella persicaria]KAI8087598.1 P-loop containing nucleoside triphosphate hydrolase protein [Gilbertella persicaria]
MSRHRAVRNLDIDDVLEEDDYNSEYDENELDETQLSNEDMDKLDDGLAYVYSIIGYDTFLTAKEIKEALWYYYFDREETVDWALDKIAAEEKKRAKEEAKKAAITEKKAAAAAQKKATPKPKSKPKDDQVEFLSDEEEMAQDMKAMGLTNPKPAEPLAKIPASKRVNVAEEFQKRSGEKPKLNLVVIGHVDAGKSTLMGHFLYDLGQVNERTMRKFERDSQKIGKGSFAFAWVLDETGEERDRGITMDIATNYFETEHRAFTLLDAPGHRDFIPNMISGTAQADAAILVVDASTNAFESGFDAGGQTKEHAVLARSLGVQQLIVAINKLDTTEWSQARYQEIESKLGVYLSQVGFKKSKMTFIPVSGLTGENLVKKSKEPALTSWYKDGPTLMEQIDKFDAPTRLLDRPLRMRVTDFFKGGIGSSGGVSVAGNIESGHVQVGEQVMIVPGNEVGYVKTMQVNEEPSTWAAAGDSVLMTLVNLDILNLSNGCVLCSGSNPVPVTTTFEAQIVVFDIRIPITPGYPIVLHHGSLDEPASILKLVEILDKSTGEVIKKNPRVLTKGMTAKVQVKLSQRPIPLETFKDNKQLGRIMLRKDGETVAAGVVNEILTFGS